MSTPVKKTDVVLVESNRLLCTTITSFLRKHRELCLAVYENLKDFAIRRARNTSPTVILVDPIFEQDLNSLSMLRKEMPGTSVIIMNSRLAQTELVEYVRSGVSGFILKDAPLEDYLRTIRLVAEGKKVLPPPLTGSVFAQIVSDGLRNGTKKLDSSGLTRQEQKIIELIADGLRDKEIAQRLNIALATVKSHVHSILQKLHFRGRLEISNLAHKNSAT